MQKQLAAPDRLSVWFSAQYLKALLSVGLRRFLFATLSGSFALTGLFFSMQVLGQGWQTTQPFERIAFASMSGDRSRLNSPGGGCGSLDGGTVNGSGSGGSPSADLEVTKFVDKPNPREGDTIVYTIFLANLGPDNAASVRVRDVLPGGVTYAGAIPSRGDYDPDSGLWSIDNLSKCGNATLTLSATVNNGTPGKTITNTASYVSAELPDSNPNNNAGEAVIIVQPPARADLAITKTVNVTNPNAGDTIIYTVTVFNNGPDDATGVQISDTLPVSLTFQRYTATQGVYTGGIWMVGNLSNTASATLTIEVKVNEDTSGQAITNTASIFAVDQIDTITNNNARQVTIIVASVISHFTFLPVIFKEPLACAPYGPKDLSLTNTAEISAQRIVNYANRYTVEVKVPAKSTSEYGITFGHDATDPNKYFRFGIINSIILNSTSNIPPRFRLKLQLGRDVDDSTCITKNTSTNYCGFTNSTIRNFSNYLKVECDLDTIKLYLNNKSVPVWESSAYSCRGGIGIFLQSRSQITEMFKDFQISCPYH